MGDSGDEGGGGRREKFTSERSERKRSRSPSPSGRPQHRPRPEKDRRQNWGRGGGGGRGSGGWGGGGRGGRRGYGRGYGGPPPPPSKMTFKEFLGRQPNDITIDEAQKRYEKYTKDFQGEQMSSFFADRQDSAWMRERYDPVVVAGVYDELAKAAASALAKFTERIETEDADTWPKYAYDAAVDVPPPPEPTAAEKEKESADTKKEQPSKLDTSLSSSQASSKQRKSRGVCYAFQRGECNRGDSCRFSHDLEDVDPATINGVPGRTLFAAALPRSLTRAEAIAIFAAVPGFEAAYGPVEIDPRALTRRLWVTYDTREDATKALESLIGKRIGTVNGNGAVLPPDMGAGTRGEQQSGRAGERLQVRMCPGKKWPPMPSLRLVPPSGVVPSRMQHDLAQAHRVMVTLDQRAGIASSDPADAPEEGAMEPETEAERPKNPVGALVATAAAAAAAEEGGLSVEQQLDLVLWYLRDVHGFDYYTCTCVWWPWVTKRLSVPAETAIPASSASAAGKADDDAMKTGDDKEASASASGESSAGATKDDCGAESTKEGSATDDAPEAMGGASATDATGDEATEEGEMQSAPSSSSTAKESGSGGGGGEGKQQPNKKRRRSGTTASVRIDGSHGETSINRYSMLS